MNRPAADPRRNLPPPAVSLAMLLQFGLLASLLGIVAHGDNVLGIDVTVLEAIQDIDLAGVEAIVTITNALFSTVGALVLALVFLALTRLLNRPEFVLPMVIVMVLRLLGQFKPIFDSPRPGIEYQPDPSLVSSNMGYPSGHAYTATVVMSMLVLFTHSLDVPAWVRRGSIALAVVVTLIATFSRIWIGAHWPTDTIGGVLYGLATIALMQLIVRFIDRRRASPATTIGA